MQLPHSSVAVVLGTRPEIIKLAGIINELGEAASIVHTGQHFDDELSRFFFEAFALPDPAVHLGVGGKDRAAQIAAGVAALAEHFDAMRPQAVIVQGDTNSTAAGGLAANAVGIPLVHVEAGLRSYDRRMPEEHNRVITDHLSDLCLTPTQTTEANLAAEGIAGGRVEVTGNTVVEAVTALLPPPDVAAAMVEARGLEPDQFVVATIHRPENVDDREQLEAILKQLAGLQQPVVFPVHPRTGAMISSAGLGHYLDGLVATAPLGYPEFLALASRSAFLISDSGGVQEEASIIKRPVIVVRRSTERPEVQGTFARLVAPGSEIEAAVTEWIGDVASKHRELATLPSPYGDGTASVRSVQALHRLIG